MSLRATVPPVPPVPPAAAASASRVDSGRALDRKSTRLNSSHGYMSYAVFCLKKKTTLESSTTAESRRLPAQTRTSQKFRLLCVEDPKIPRLTRSQSPITYAVSCLIIDNAEQT